MKTRTSGPVRGEDSSAGLVVRKRRTELRITQAALGEAVGVSRQTVISIETGDYAPSVFCALRVARVLGVTVEDLWGASA